MFGLHEIACRSIRKGKLTSTPRTVWYDRNDDGPLPLMGIDDDTYRMDELPASAEFGEGRAFELGKVGEPEARYNVWVGVSEKSDICDCIGFEARGYCKHCDCLRGLIQRGVIDDPLDHDWPRVSGEEYYPTPSDLGVSEWEKDYTYSEVDPFA